MRFVVYGRISGAEQSVYSLEAQISECKIFAERLGHEFVEAYIDDGESGKDLNRPEIIRLIDDLKKSKFDLVVSWKLDRLTRDTVDGLTLIINLFKKKHNVTYMSATEDIKTETADDIMMLTIRLSLAQAEREKIRERVTLGQMTRAKAGKRNSSTRPYGYNIDKDLNLTPNEEESDVVRRIYNYYVLGMGQQKIADILNDDNVPAPKGEVWFISTIGLLIGNVIHVGANHWKRKEDPEEKRIIVFGMHEPIVPKVLFDAAMEIKTKRKEGDMSKSNYEFCFSSIIKCGECGRSYHGKQITKPRYGKYTRNYRCSGKYQMDRCKGSDISEIKLTKLFLNYISNFTFKMDVPDKTIGGRDTVKDRKKLEKSLSDSAVKKDRYTRAWGANVIEYEKFLELMKEETDKKKQWQLELDEMNQQTPTHKKKHSDVAKGIQDLEDNWIDMTVLERKMALYKVFKYIVIKKENDVWKVAASLLN